MPMSHAELEARLTAAFPDSEIVLTDLAGDNDHWKARIVSPAFKGLPRVRQHQLVNRALADVLGGTLHALALETAAPTAILFDVAPRLVGSLPHRPEQAREIGNRPFAVENSYRPMQGDLPGCLDGLRIVGAVQMDPAGAVIAIHQKLVRPHRAIQSKRERVHRCHFCRRRAGRCR